MSVLTSDFDWGTYVGSLGIPHFPWANSSYFSGTFSGSVISGPYGIYTERWQLRARGYSYQAWNGCGQTTQQTPLFSGFVIARFSFAFTPA